MAGNTTNGMAAVAAGIDAGTIYSDFVEPLLCILYAFLIAKVQLITLLLDFLSFLLEFIFNRFHEFLSFFI